MRCLNKLSQTGTVIANPVIYSDIAFNKVTLFSNRIRINVDGKWI